MAALVLLLVLVLLGGLIAGGVMLIRRAGKGDGAGAARQLVVYGFAFVVLVVAATGVAQLIGHLIPAGATLVERGAGSLARALALTVVGVPGFLLLWSYLRRRLQQDPTDRESPGWAVFLAFTTLTFLIGGLIGLGNGIEWLTGLDTSGREALGFGLVWGGVWWWSWRLLPGRFPPGQLGELAAVVGSLVGLAVSAGSLAAGLGIALGAAYETWLGTTLAGEGLGEDLVRSALWLALGGLVWWQHWLTAARRATGSTLQRLYLLVVGVLGGAVTSLTAAGTLLFGLLEWFLGDPAAGSAAAHFRPLPAQVTAIVVGGLVWAYHRSVIVEQPAVFETTVGRSYRYLFSGLGLIAAASGVGMVVNALIEAAVVPLAERGATIDTLLAGVSALAVGGPVWWRTWLASDRTGAAWQAEVTSVPRRVYLTVLAGIGGVVALITLVVLLFRLFEGVLEGDNPSAVLDDVSSPLGLVTATALVGWYHLVIWRRERPVREAEAEADDHPRLQQVILVAADPARLAERLRRQTGAAVTVFPRADAAESDGLGEEEVLAALDEVTTGRALVLVENGHLRVIPLRR